MTKKTIDIRDFRDAARAPGMAPNVRFTTVADPAISADTRTASFVFSDESVDRYGDTIKAAGWRLDEFNANPIALFGHDAGSVENVIGRAKNVRVDGTRLVGDIEFMGADVNPKAEAVYRMVKGGFLKTVSVGFAPIEWEPTRDKSRPGGVDFKKQNLLEISVVPLPANPNAVALAKAAGIDVDRLGLVRSGEVWACGAARDLPIDDADAWDGAAAEKRIFDDAGFDGEHPDAEKAARAFLFHDSAHPTLRGSYKEPFADIVGGELKAIKGGLHAAASRLDGTDVPDAVKAKGKAVIDAYEARMNPDKADKAARPDYKAMAQDFTKRGLGECADFAFVLEYADIICSRVEREAANEGDNSPNAVRFRAWVDDGNRLLAAMTTEETAENIAGTQGSPWGDAKSLTDAVERAVATALKGAGITKAGRRLSAETEKSLRTAHDHIKSASTFLLEVINPEDDPDDDGDDDTDPNGDPDDDGEDMERAARERRRRRVVAMKLRMDAGA